MKYSEAEWLELFRLLKMARKIETELVSHAKMTGYHAAVGEEAIIVGTFFGLRSSDIVAPHYRGGIVAAYVHGGDLRKLIAGAFVKETAYNMSRFRGDVCFPAELNMIGHYSGHLGSPLGLATGAALAQKQRKTGNVAVATFGEGTSNLGIVHESINLAACLDLPVIFVCQNNQYSISTNYQKAMKCASVADRAKGYGIPGVSVDGNDVLAVQTAVATAVERARAGLGPTLIEALSYRISGHWAIDTAEYQNEQERQAWLARDPIAKLREQLLRRSHVNEAEIDAAIEEEFRTAFNQAMEDPEPGERALGLDSVFAFPSA